MKKYLFLVSLWSTYGFAGWRLDEAEKLFTEMARVSEKSDATEKSIWYLKQPFVFLLDEGELKKVQWLLSSDSFPKLKKQGAGIYLIQSHGEKAKLDISQIDNGEIYLDKQKITVDDLNPREKKVSLLNLFNQILPMAHAGFLGSIGQAFKAPFRLLMRPIDRAAYGSYLNAGPLIDSGSGGVHCVSSQEVSCKRTASANAFYNSAVGNFSSQYAAMDRVPKDRSRAWGNTPTDVQNILPSDCTPTGRSCQNNRNAGDRGIAFAHGNINNPDGTPMKERWWKNGAYRNAVHAGGPVMVRDQNGNWVRQQ